MTEKSRREPRIHYTGARPAPDLDDDGVAELLLIQDGAVEVWRGASRPGVEVLGRVALDPSDLVDDAVLLAEGNGDFVLAIGNRDRRSSL